MLIPLFISAILGIAGLAYFEEKVKIDSQDGFFEHGWSAYLAWVSAILLLLVNLPVMYLINIPVTDHAVYTRAGKENQYELSTAVYSKRNEKELR